MIVYSNSNDMRVCRAARAVLSRGDSVDLFCLRSQIRQSVVNFTHVYNAPVDKYQKHGRGSYILSYIRFFLWSFWKLNSMFLRRRFDLIHVHNMPNFLVFCALLPKLFGKKVILDMHDSMPDIYMSRYGVTESHWFIRLLKAEELMSTKFADKLIAVHEPHKDLLIKHGVCQRKIEILMNLPDDRLFHPRGNGRNHERFTMVYHGSLSHRLGLDIAIRAVNLVRREIPTLIFKIIGTGEELRHLMQLAAQLGLEENVYFKGPVPMDKIQSAIEDADLAVIPSRKDSATDLMLPVKLLEYVFVGIPCIVPPTVAIMHYFDENMVDFFQQENVEDLADKILRLYKDPGRREEMVFNARQFCNKYTWETHKINYLKTIDALST